MDNEKQNNFIAARLLTCGGDDPFMEHLRPLFRSADAIDMVVSFVRSSGLRSIEYPLLDARDRGVPIRILTGDYMDITEVEALNLLMDWSADGRISTWIYESRDGSFHPKSYIFHYGSGGCAYVGSSNLSFSALGQGIEWNYRIDSCRDLEGFLRIKTAFEALLLQPQVRPLDSQWLREYRKRCMAFIPRVKEPELMEQEQPPEPVTPNVFQEEALKALKETRANNFKAGLVVLATGLGKTYLAAFDSQRLEKVLFVAHREEILAQSLDSFRRIRPETVFGTYTGKEKNLDADVIFASVQTLSRQEHLSRFAPDDFDYIIIDEFHHACASTYRKILAYFQPKFLLGLTATPERRDQGDLLSLCQGNLVYERGFVAGITRGLLIPFHYFGIRDPVDYQTIPWRSGKFDPAELEKAVDTQKRSERILEEWKRHGGKRTLAFCCSTTHADYMCRYFSENGVKCGAVHSGTHSAPRGESIEKLKRGDISVIFSVDIFNEGLDVPVIDTVMMLRPTESPVIFLQQLGRGLRRAEGKEYLTVIDLIGNHRSFLLKPRTLLSLSEGTMRLAKALDEISKGEVKLPEGCSINFEVKLIDMMKEFLKISPHDAIMALYEEFKLTHGRRMNAREIQAAGLNLNAIRSKYAGWFHFLRSQGDLSESEDAVLDLLPEWFIELEKTEMTKCFKMITLQALIEKNELTGKIDIADIAQRSLDILRRNPLLIMDINKSEFPDPDDIDMKAWISYWVKNPIAAWTGGFSSSKGRFFSVEKPLFLSSLKVPEHLQETLVSMTEELVDYKLLAYENRVAGAISEESGMTFRAKIIHTGGRPIIKLPSRKTSPFIPFGEVEVHIDGMPYNVRFVREFINVAGMPGKTGNVLPEILRKWFGPRVGHPGTDFHVAFNKVGNTWEMTPDGARKTAEIIAYPNKVRLPYYQDLKAACGAFKTRDYKDPGGEVEFIDIETAKMNADPGKYFIVRAQGDSMDGGRTPIKDGDLVLFEWLTAGTPIDVDGRICLVEKQDENDSVSHAVKRIVRRGDGNYLKSEKPPSTEEPVAFDRILPLARFVEVVTAAEDH